MLRDVLGFSVRETVALLQTSEGAVKTALHRARRALKATEENGTGNRPDDGARGPIEGDTGTAGNALEMVEDYRAGYIVRLLNLIVSTGKLAPMATAIGPPGTEGALCWLCVRATHSAADYSPHRLALCQESPGRG